jgi:hypothetical protein
MYKNLFILSLLVFTTLSYAESERRQHDAHQHGVADLNIALSKHELVIELRSPAYNVFGFEHNPTNEQEAQYVVERIALLKKADQLFSINPKAVCQLRTVEIENPFEHHLEEDHEHDKTNEPEGDYEHHEHEGDHEHHEHEGDHEHHEHEGDHEHHEHEGDHEHHEPEKTTHTDIEALYRFSCKKAQQITSLDALGLFTKFPNFETLNVQWVSDIRQSAKHLSKDNSNVTFK